MVSVRQWWQWLAPTFRPGDGWRTGLVLVIWAMAVQGVFLWETVHALYYRYPLVDAAVYFQQAQELARGVGTPGAFWQPPGYAYWLSVLCVAGGGSVWLVRVLQALILAPVGAWLLWRVSRRLLSPVGACIAVGMASLTGPLLFYQSQLLPAAPAALLVTAVLLLALRAGERPSAARWLITGVVNGVTLLVVATTAALLPVLAVGAWCTPVRRAQRARHVAALLGGALLVLTPVALRNFNACGKWVWLSTNGGTNFYIGNCREWTVTLTTQPGFDWDKLMRVPYLQNQVQDAVDADRQFQRMAWQDIRRAPAVFLQRLVRKALAFWHGREIPRNLDIYGWRDSSWLLRATVWREGLCFPMGVLVPLALVGVGACWRQRPVRWLAGAAVASGLFVALYFPCSRYRVPVLPVVVLLAVAGAQALWEAWRTQAWRTVGVRVCLLLVAGVAVNAPLAWPTDQIRYDAHLWNAMGVAADIRRDPSTAKRCYEEAVRRDARLADAQFNLGTMYTRGKDAQRAESCYEAAVAARADHDKARVNLGICLADRGKLAEALHQFTMAEMLNPLNAEAFANHAAVLQRAGRTAEAVEMLRRAAALELRYRALFRALERQVQGQGR